MTRTRHRWPRIGASAIAFAVPVLGCGGARSTPDSRLVDVVAAFYPAAYLTQRIGGGDVAVETLTPSGAEPHDLELSTKQVDAILDARLVVLVGGGFQPAVEQAAKQRDGETVDLRALVANGERRRDDPHVWLDPTIMQQLASGMEQALARVDPGRRAAYARRASSLRRDLAALDDRYRVGLAACERHDVVTAHAAFGYLARRYDLRQEGVAGLSPDAEPSPRRVAELADLVQRRGVTTVFTETLVSPKVAETLAREAGGVRTETLDPLEGLTSKQRARGDDYITVMDANLAKLRAALGCR